MFSLVRWALVGVALSSAPLWAQEASQWDKQPTLKCSQVRDVLIGLSNLDGYEKTVKNNGQDAVIKEAYKLGGKVRLQIANDIAALKAMDGPYQMAHDALVRQYSGGGTKVLPQNEAKFLEEVQPIEEADCSKNIILIKTKDLNLDDNPNIPPSILGMILPITDMGLGK